MSATAMPVSRIVHAVDGLRLHALDYGPFGRTPLPVVCLAGLARTALDFDRLARRLARGSAGAPRRVLALDYRGRGGSGRDVDPSRYDILIENADILTMLDALGIARAIVVGTSRGGIHAMVLAATRPRLLHAVVMNDIGPVIESQGIARIRAYVGKLPQPTSMEDAVDLCRRLAGAHFPDVSTDDWRVFAQATFEEKAGRLVPRYDPALLKTLSALDLDVPLPTLWPQFMALSAIPVLALRGANSDLLAPETLRAMADRHPRCQTVTIEGQGHAPLLLDELTLGTIERFIGHSDPS